jgi:hypothetical protein
MKLTKSIVTVSAMAIAFVLSPATAVAGGQDAAPAAAEAKPDPKKERKVCRTVALSESRLGKRQCRTQAEWDGDAERTRGTVDKMRRDSGN